MTATLTRKEDLRLVTGAGCYSADRNLPGQLHAVFVRADRAHAELIAIDAGRARALPGVVAVVTADDLAASGYKSLPCVVNYPGRGGEPMLKPHFPVLAAGKIRYLGEPVAMVVAQSPAVAEDARDLIEVEYRDLPAVVTIEDALREGAPQLHADVPGNLAMDYESGDEAAVDAAFARAALTTTLTVDSQRLVGNPLETRAFLARHDEADGGYTIYTCTQGMMGMRGQLSHITGLPPEKLRVIAQDVGGSFGVHAAAYPEYLAVMHAAKALGRPVKWVATRAETFVSDTHGRALSLTGQLAMDREGNFLAIRFDDRADLGAYPAAFGAFIATKNLTITIAGVYRIPAVYGRCRLAYTNTVPVSAYRGAGRPDIAYAIERLVDQAAVEHGFDPVALRRRNFISREEMPYQTPNAGAYDCGDFAGVLDDALKHADWKGYGARKAASEKAGRLRGIGFSTYLEAGGGGSAPKDQVTVEFGGDGNAVLYAITQSNGQGHETTFPQIVADTLGVPVSHFRLQASAPGHELVGSGTGGSRAAAGTGSAFRVLGEKLIELARPHAAAALGAAAADLAYRDGAFHAAGRSIGFIDLARRIAGPRPHPLDTLAEGSYGATYPNGCHVAEVEIDPETGATRVVAYTAVDDLGNIITPKLVEGQVHGGVMQGAGQVFGEQAVYDRESGQLLSGSFMDYAMPRAGLLPAMKVEEHPVPTATNALGAKGVGESGCSGSLPALMNAVMNAVRPLGVRHLDMPVTPARLWTALRDARSGRP